MTALTQTHKGDTVILKRGRKIYATISQNTNPEYNWMVWFKTGMALSGYSSKEAAIIRAKKMNNDVDNILSSLTVSK